MSEHRQPPSSRQRNPRGAGLALREELITAAGTLLEEVPSVDLLSLRAVARQAGVSAPSVYLHFEDKLQLVLAVLERRFATLRAAVAERTHDLSDPRAELRAACEAYCDFATANPGSYRVMFETSLPEPGPDGVPLNGADIVRGLAAAIDRVTRDVSATGSPPPPRALQAATLLWCALHGLVSLSATHPAYPWPERATMITRLLDAACALPDDAKD